MRTVSLAEEKQGGFISNLGIETPASLSFKGQATKHTNVKWSSDLMNNLQSIH